VLRYSENYHDIPQPQLCPLPKEKLDSALRERTYTDRSSGFTLNYPFDQAIFTNRAGNGAPTEAILAPVRRMEKMARFGPPTERLAKMRKLCGV
jgi:hypothetical protein